jgi:uncharacterized protein (TIGR02145 family)
MNTKQAKKTFLLAALALFAGACTVNLNEPDPAPAAGDGDRLVTLALSVPASPASRGLTTDEESEVKSIDVLLFKVDATEYFYYRAIGDIDPVTGKKFSVKLPGGTWNVVVLANAGQAFDKLVDPHKSLLAPAKTAPDVSIVARREVLEHLVLQLNDETKKWPEGTFAGIPMWGYYNALVINSSTPATAATIDLTRAIARVNVSVVDDDDLDEYDVTAVFSLASVHLYNYNRAGSIAPAAINGAGYDGTQWSGSEATLPNLPALGLLVDNATPLKVTGPLDYNVPPAQKHDYSGEIYTFEAAAGTGTSLSTNTCLVIGGNYNGELSYYRVDFAKSDGTYLSLLRNHSYNVKIKEVFAAGYASIDEAFDNKPSNIKVEIDEDDGTIGHVVFNEQNFLGASTGEITVPANAKTGYGFTANTDVFDGWEITGTSVTDEPHAGFDVSWITGITPASGSAGGTTNVTFNASENTSGARRVGYIHLQAGRLHLAVKVTQLTTGIWITDTGNTEIQELVFESTGGAQPAAQQFLLHWVPAEAQVNSMSIPASGYPVFAYDPAHHVPGEGTMIGISGPPSEMTVDIRPAALPPGEIDANPFVEKASMVRFVAFHDGEFASTDIELRYINYHTAVDVDAIYKLDGEIHSFTVRSNTKWKISTVSDPQNILQATPVLLNLSGGNNTTGETINFRLINGAIGTNGEVTLLLTDPTGHVGNISVTIKGATCGTGGNAVSIRIGNSNDYLTHMYSTKCWMVQNSKEGSAAATRYNNNSSLVNGYYYTYSQASNTNNACPNGWRLPTYDEIDVVITAAINDEYGIGRWWWGNDGINNDAFAGYYFNGDTPYEWRNWNASGSWWVVGNNAYLYGLQGSLAKYTGGVGYNSVRCVHD